MSKWEIRGIDYEDAEVRAAGERAIEGYGVVFNKWSQDLGGFREIILPEAIEGVVERSDVLALMNHDLSRGVLARCTYGKGSMKLSADDKGVKYSFTAPRYNLGDELVEGGERGDIRASSFAFTVPQGGEKWEKRDDMWERTITKFDKIYDMSPVYSPAYTDTTVAKRSLEQIKEVSEPVVVKPPVTDEVPDEPITVSQRDAVSDLELKYKQYIQTQKFKELQ
jgi:HK97 family phage prohead protease